jgi:hypothetical protein
MTRPGSALLASLLALGSLSAQAPPDPKAPPPPDAEERLKKLEEEVQALKKAAAQPAEAPAPQLGGAGGGASKALNPDISVIGDFLGAAGHNGVRPVPALDMHEAEVGLQAIVDPYSRADVFLSFANGAVDVEEAYVTFTSLPGELRARIGKMRAEFGKVNTTHNHALAWTDRPLVTENLVNGEDGIDDMGVSLSRILPAPGDFFLEGTAQVFRGNSGTLFQATQRKDTSFVGHLRGYEDLTENTNLEIGYSHARGHNELGSAYLTVLNGADLTLRWKPLTRSIYNSFLWRTEAVWSHRDQLLGTQRSFGFYSSADYRMDQRWTFGTRYDWSQRATDALQLDRGVSLLATYWFSEFSQLRGQYRLTRYDGKQDAAELRLQLLFVLGAHGAHAF